MSTKTNHPRGVSLLEVLISIGVLAIGLLGVVALIPVASHQAEVGARQDAMSIAGRRALRDFVVRGYSQSTSWDFSPEADNEIYRHVFDQNGNVKTPLRAFCIDPFGYRLYLLQNGAVDWTTTTSAELYTFPSTANVGSDVNSGDVYLPRHTIQSGYGGPMWAEHIEEVFTFQDDLDFELPQKSGLPPEQIALADTSGLPAKRFATGSFSWFATLVPKPNSATFNLSIAVVRERSIFGSQTRDVIQIASLGGTSEVTFADPVAELKAGQWLMLMASTGTGGFADDVDSQYEWYQVVSAAIAKDDTGVERQYLTLNGPDWTSSINPLAVIVPRTVAVYSRSIPFQ